MLHCPLPPWPTPPPGHRCATIWCDEPPPRPGYRSFPAPTPGCRSGNSSCLPTPPPYHRCATTPCGSIRPRLGHTSPPAPTPECRTGRTCCRRMQPPSRRFATVPCESVSPTPGRSSSPAPTAGCRTGPGHCRHTPLLFRRCAAAKCNHLQPRASLERKRWVSIFEARPVARGRCGCGARPGVAAVHNNGSGDTFPLSCAVRCNSLDTDFLRAQVRICGQRSVVLCCVACDHVALHCTIVMRCAALCCALLRFM